MRNLRQLPITEREGAEQILNEMQKEGVIEVSNSPWDPSISVVKNNDGMNRFCIDFHIPNSVRRKLSF